MVNRPALTTWGTGLFLVPGSSPRNFYQIDAPPVAGDPGTPGVLPDTPGEELRVTLRVIYDGGEVLEDTG